MAGEWMNQPQAEGRRQEEALISKQWYVSLERILGIYSLEVRRGLEVQSEVYSDVWFVLFQENQGFS